MIRREWPVRQRSAKGEPKAATFMRGCRQCGASFLDLTPGTTGERGIWRHGYGLEWYCSVECAPEKGTP